MDPGASIIIVTYNSESTIAACLETVAQTLRPQDEVLVIDNHSRDETLGAIREQAANLSGGIRLFAQAENTGFSRGCNIGIERASKEHIILLNPDTYVRGDWIEKLTSHFRFYPKTGAVGPLSDFCLLRQNILTFVPSINEQKLPYDVIPSILDQTYKRKSIPTQLLMGFCMALRRDLVEKWGALDEDIFLGDDDLEMSWRLRERGYTLRIALDVFVQHQNHVSFETLPHGDAEKLVRAGSDILFEKMRRYYAPDKIPDPLLYFGIDWWRPTILESHPFEEIFETNLLPCGYSEIIPSVRTLIQAGKTDAAIHLLEHASQIVIRDPVLWLSLAVLYSRDNRDEDAELALKNAWALQLEDKVAEQKLVDLLRRQGREEEIESLLAQKYKTFKNRQKNRATDSHGCRDFLEY